MRFALIMRRNLPKIRHNSAVYPSYSWKLTPKAALTWVDFSPVNRSDYTQFIWVCFSSVGVVAVENCQRIQGAD